MPIVCFITQTHDVYVNSVSYHTDTLSMSIVCFITQTHDVYVNSVSHHIDTRCISVSHRNNMSYIVSHLCVCDFLCACDKTHCITLLSV